MRRPRSPLEQAFAAMFEHLSDYWREFPAANLSDVLGDIQPAYRGQSSDPAEWPRFQAAAGRVLSTS